MSPGPISSRHRGGLVYTQPRGGGFARNRAVFTMHNRTFGTPRGRFMLGTDEAGATSVMLGENELAHITTDADGNTVVTIENKPPVDGGNGNGADDTAGQPVLEASRSFVSRLRQRMSWVKEPGGEIVITPDEGETLFVTGDALQAVVTAQPTTPG